MILDAVLLASGDLPQQEHSHDICRHRPPRVHCHRCLFGTVVVVDAARKMLVRKRFSNLMSELILSFVTTLGEFQLTVEATASYEWFCVVGRNGGEADRAGLSGEAARDCREHSQE